jgi:hypothetical protein
MRFGAAMRLLPVLLLASACAAGSGREADLSSEIAGRAEGPPERCVTGSGANLSVRDSRTLVYDQGDAIWVNRLPAACPGLRRSSMLIIEPDDGSRYCRGDRFRAAEPTGGVAGPYCALGEFTPYRRQAASTFRLPPSTPLPSLRERGLRAPAALNVDTRQHLDKPRRLS